MDSKSREFLAKLDSIEFDGDLAAFGDEEYEPKALTNNTFQSQTRSLPPVSMTYDVELKIWYLLAEYSYTDNVLDCTLTAPQGYSFDLASVPRLFWIFLAPNELSIVAPLFHDLIYQFEGSFPTKGKNKFDYVKPYRSFTRKEADKLFHRLMKKEGVPAWRRYIAYKAVRLFGGTYWPE